MSAKKTLFPRDPDAQVIAETLKTRRNRESRHNRREDRRQYRQLRDELSNPVLTAEEVEAFKRCQA